MNTLLRRFFAGFHFRINKKALLYIAISFAALAGAIPGAVISGGDMVYIILSGCGIYVAGRIIVWVFFRNIR